MTLQAALTAVDAQNVATELERDEARELGLLNLVEPRTSSSCSTPSEDSR